MTDTPPIKEHIMIKQQRIIVEYIDSVPFYKIETVYLPLS